MLLAEKYAIADYNAVRNEDRAEGRAEGITEGESRVARLMGQLLAANRVQDAKRASEDVAFRESLYAEFSIV